MPKYIIIKLLYVIKETKYLIEYKYKTAAVKRWEKKIWEKRNKKSSMMQTGQEEL